MTAAASPADAASGRGARDDSAFETSAFDKRRAPASQPWAGWRRQGLMVAALLGCLGLAWMARGLADMPDIDATWASGPAGELVLRQSPLPSLHSHRGEVAILLSRDGRPPVPLDAGLSHHWPRWEPEDALRARRLSQQQAVTQLLASGPGTVTITWASSAVEDLELAPRGYRGLGLAFWPSAFLALLLYLVALTVVVARPRPRSVLFAVMALCQAANLVLVALESGRGLGLPGLWLAAHMPLQLALDLCTAAAGVHVFSLYPAGLPRARVVSAVAWACVAAWLALALAGWVGPVWWTGQSLCIALGLAALWVAGRSHAVEPNPYTRVTRRLSAAALIAMVAVTLAVAFTAQMPARERAVAAAAPAVLYGLLALQLLFTPFLSHSRQLLREFVLLAAICAVASVLGLLFVAVFSIGKLASLACAALIGLGLYLGARQWLLNRLAGASLLATERAFEQIYRAARTVQAHPQRYGKQLTQLLRDLFEPLEVERTDRVPERSRLLGGGSTLVVPLRGAADQTGSAPRSTAAIALRFAHQGRRLFTLEDARLADRLIDQLRRAVAYDMAVEHGRSEERQRIAQDLHDDIGARLLTLMYRTQDPEMENYIRHTLQDLKTLTRGLAASEHRLSHAAAEWKADLMQRATVAQVELRWSFAFDRDLLLSMVQWSALTRVLRELVSNALFHGEATQIDVTFALQGPQMTLQVADDGNGRSPEQWAHGLGLGGVRKRVKALGGEVAWVENRDRGIVCKVRVARFGEPG